MTKYLIYTSNDIEPFVIETDEDLFYKYIHAMDRNQPTMFVRYDDDMREIGLYNCKILLNTHQIVAITTTAKKE